jgi:pimeloyl-ACP methyl ester carboxylesterase
VEAELGKRLTWMLAGLMVLGLSQTAGAQVGQVRSRDGTAIAVECAGSGPELLIVHGGTGDRTRWTPMFPYLERDFTVCAMDRRAHGQSGDGPEYSLAKEAEDVAAVVESRPRRVVVVGHSFGGVAAYEAAFLTPRIAKLVLYEPALGVGDHAAALARMEALIKGGDRDAATATFLREVVRVSPQELAAMRARPSWTGLVSSIESSIRQDRALSANSWNAARARTLRTPTLLLLGSRTQSAELRGAVQRLSETLPEPTVVVLEGQEHNAMDTDREHLANVIKAFALPSR